MQENLGLIFCSILSILGCWVSFPSLRRCCSSRTFNLYSAELESGNALGACLQTPAPVLDKIPGPMGARFLSSIGLGCGTLIGRAQIFPVPVLDKNRSPSSGFSGGNPEPWKIDQTKRCLEGAQKLLRKLCSLVPFLPPVCLTRTLLQYQGLGHYIK